jgi:predicted DCC family thiol-disulfide oxidoreductase YuxK
MKTLTIFYDARCGLCSRFRAWLLGQPLRISVEFLAYDSEVAAHRFPGLRELGADREVVVMADDGRWWQGEGAWVTCLWATRDYQLWAHRLSSPALLPFVRKAVHLISENRLGLSRLLRVSRDSDLAEALREQPEPACVGGTCAVPTSTSFPS